MNRILSRCLRMTALILAVFSTGISAALPAGAERLSLAECLKLARERHPELARSRALVRATEARLRASRSGYLPRLDLGLSHDQQTYNYAGTPGTPPRLFRLFSRPESNSTSPYYYTGVNFSQTIYDSGRTKGAVLRSEAETAAARDSLRRMEDTVSYNVASSYIGVLAARELVRIRVEAAQNQQKHLDQARAFFEVGRRPKIDVTKQEVALASAQVDLHQAEENLAVARAALATAIGLPIDQAPEPLDQLSIERKPEELAPLLEEAGRNRPDLKALADQVRSAQADVLVAKATMKPSFNFSSFYSFRNLRFPLVYNWGLGELLSQNLISSGGNRAHLEEAEAQEEAVERNLDSLRLNLEQEVFTALADLQLARDKIGLALKAEDEARENLELAEGRYQAGVGNIIELTDAQLLSTDTQVQEVTSRYQYQIAGARLDFSVGRQPR